MSNEKIPLNELPIMFVNALKKLAVQPYLYFVLQIMAAVCLFVMFIVSLAEQDHFIFLWLNIIVVGVFGIIIYYIADDNFDDDLGIDYSENNALFINIGISLIGFIGLIIHLLL